MLSRVAERLYWLGRYLEREEGTARNINVNTHLLLDLPKGTTFGWEPLIFIMGGEELFFRHYRDAGQQNALTFMLADPRNPIHLFLPAAGARKPPHPAGRGAAGGLGEAQSPAS